MLAVVEDRPQAWATKIDLKEQRSLAGSGAGGGQIQCGRALAFTRLGAGHEQGHRGTPAWASLADEARP